MKRIVVTGAAGIVGKSIRPFLQDLCDELVLTDVQPMVESTVKETYQKLDVVDLSAVENCVQGASAIVHLAGLVGPDFTFDQVLGANIVGTHNVFEAARRQGVSQVIFASSHHAVGFYERSALIDHNALPKPDSFYGVSKACGEALASYYADKHGLNILVIRIGFVGEQAVDERRVHTWISPRDLAQLIRIGLENPALGCEIVYGVSQNPEPFFDNHNAERLGYHPQDRAVEHLADPDLMDAEPDPNSPDGRYVGGHFVIRHEELKS